MSFLMGTSHSLLPTAREGQSGSSAVLTNSVSFRVVGPAKGRLWTQWLLNAVKHRAVMSDERLLGLGAIYLLLSFCAKCGLANRHHLFQRISEYININRFLAILDSFFPTSLLLVCWPKPKALLILKGIHSGMSSVAGRGPKGDLVLTSPKSTVGCCCQIPYSILLVSHKDTLSNCWLMPKMPFL